MSDQKDSQLYLFAEQQKHLHYQIRKQNREAFFNHKRGFHQNDNQDTKSQVQLSNSINECFNILLNGQFVEEIEMSLDILLGISSKYSLSLIFDSGIAPTILSFINGEYQSLSLKAARCIVNLSSAQEYLSSSLLEQSGLQIILNTLNTKSLQMAQYGLLIISNISFQNSQFRNEILKSQYFQQIIRLSQMKDVNTRFFNELALFLSTLCFGSSLPDSSLVQKQITYLCKLIESEQLPNSTIKHVLYSIRLHINNYIELISSRLSFLKVLLEMNGKSVKIGLQIIVIILSSDCQSRDDVCQFLIQNNILQKLSELLQSKSSKKVEYALLLLNNLAITHSLDIYKYPGIIEKASLLLQSSKKCPQIAKEVCYFLNNIILDLKEPSIRHLVIQCQILQGFLLILSENINSTLTTICLLSLKAILQANQQQMHSQSQYFPILQYQIDKLQGNTIFQELALHQNQSISSNSSMILEVLQSKKKMYNYND